MKKTLIAGCLFLSALGQAQAETEIDRLVAASQIIAEKLHHGRHAAAGLQYYAVDGKVAPNGIVLPAFITPDEVTAYNNSVNDVSQRIYYNTQMMLEDKYEENMVALDIAVDTFIEATATIAIAVEVADKAESTDQSSVEQQEQLQEFVQTNDVKIEQQDVNEYNNALSDIETYSQNAAAFLAASRMEQITGSVDNDAQAYNLNMSQANATFNASQESLTFSWASSNYTHGFYGFFTGNGAVVSQQEVMGMGQSIYENQEFN